MRSINKVILIGNLTRDPELRQTPNGQNVVTFGLATNREWITKDGTKQTSAEFHDLVAWAKLADICYKYLKKGKLVYIEGYLKTRSWDDKENNKKKFRTEIVIQDMIMLNKRDNSEDDTLPVDETIIEEQAETYTSDEQTETTQENSITKEEEEEKQENKESETSQSLDIDSDLGL